MYVPILKWKQGEQWACRGLAAAVAHNTYPVFEIPPRPVDAKTKAPTKSVEDYLDTVAKTIGASWKTGSPFAVDVTLLEESIDHLSAGRAMERLFKQLRQDGLRPVPVARSDHKPSRLQLAKKVAAAGGDGVMIRCLWDDVGHGTMNEMLAYLVGELDIPADRIDLLVDLRTVSADNFAGLEANVTHALGSILNPGSWRSLVVASSAFPRNLTGMKPGRRPIPRLDWKLYHALRPMENNLGRQMFYGDYGIAHWEMADIDVVQMQMSANLRYTSDDDWVVFRGRSVNLEGYGQYIDLCALLVADGIYCGPDYSMGDQNYSLTTNPAKPGNASSWRRDGTNHHVTFVVNQLATLGAL
jgi:hypothetical protein